MTTWYAYATHRYVVLDNGDTAIHEYRIEFDRIGRPTERVTISDQHNTGYPEAVFLARKKLPKTHPAFLPPDAILE